MRLRPRVFDRVSQSDIGTQFTNLRGVAGGVEGEDDQVLVARDNAGEGVLDGAAARVVAALLDVDDGAGAALAKMRQSLRERPEGDRALGAGAADSSRAAPSLR